MRLVSLTSTAMLLLCGVACSASDGANYRTETNQDEIINGTLDQSRHAVVAVLSNQSACTGTIVSKDVARGIGYVLTAAHCVDPSFPPLEVRQGNDWTSPTAVYSVLGYAEHPAYGNGNIQYDIGMIRIAGVTAATPTMEIGESTAVTNGMQVMSVGYGLTGPGDNTRRYNITKNLNNVGSSIISYSLSGGGICSGDSGGPVLTTGSAQQVIAVHSSVDQATSSSCSGNGYSVRVSAYYDSFIRPFIEEQVEQTCEVCMQVAQSGSCSGSIDACFNNSSCTSLVECLNACNSGDSACIQSCATTHSAGIALYNAIFDCSCDACPTECAAECAGPTCGFQFQEDACTTCHEANCCSEGVACAESGECTTCVTSETPAASCDTNAERVDWFTCLEQNCPTECGFGSGGSGGSGGAGGSGGSGGSGAGGSGAGGSGAGGAGGSAQGGSGGSAQGGSAGTEGGSAGTSVGGSGGSSGNANAGTAGGEDFDEGSSTATCTLSVANSGTGSPFAVGLALLGLLGFGLRRRRQD